MKKIVFQNLSITIISKIFAFISFLYIAKFLTTYDYGVFVYITMLLSLLPLFQFGSMHGATILLPKYIADKNKDENNLFLSYNYFSHILQFLSVLLLFLFDIDLNISILFVIALNFLLSKYIQNVQIYLNANHKFEKSNIIKAIDQILKPIIVLTLFMYYKNIESIFIAQMIVTFFSFIISIYLVRFRLISISFPNFTETTKQLYKIGFFIYLVWAIDILFRTVDRLFISQFYSLEDLATYGFTSSLAMNIWLLAMSFFAPFAQVLYKHVAENNFLEVKEVVESTNKKLYILLSIVSILVIAFYPFILEYFIHKYFGTELLFFILVLTSVFLSLNNMYIYYMISNNFYFILLKYQIVILSLNILLNATFAYLHLEIISYGYSTVLTLFIYFLLVKRYFYIDIEKKLEIKTI